VLTVGTVALQRECSYHSTTVTFSFSPQHISGDALVIKRPSLVELSYNLKLRIGVTINYGDKITFEANESSNGWKTTRTRISELTVIYDEV
jgi:hypothetical protein